MFLPAPDNAQALAAAVYLWRHETGDCESVCASFASRDAFRRLTKAERDALIKFVESF